MSMWNTLREMADTRQHEHQVNVMYPAGKDEYVWPGKQDEIYYLEQIIVCKIEPLVTTKNELCDHYRIPK